MIHNQIEQNYKDFSSVENHDDYYDFTFNDTLFGDFEKVRDQAEGIMTQVKNTVRALAANNFNFQQLIRSNNACKNCLLTDLTDVPVFDLIMMQQTLMIEYLKLN